jgi:hypothetical protein
VNIAEQEMDRAKKAAKAVETFGNFAPPLAKSGGWRLFAELEKPAVGGHFSNYYGGRFP